MDGQPTSESQEIRPEGGLVKLRAMAMERKLGKVVRAICGNVSEVPKLKTAQGLGMSLAAAAKLEAHHRTFLEYRAYDQPSPDLPLFTPATQTYRHSRDYLEDSSTTPEEYLSPHALDLVNSYKTAFTKDGADR